MSYYVPKVVNGHDHLAGLSSEMHTIMLGQRPRDELCRGGFHPNFRNENAAGFLRGALVLVDHPSYVGDLTRGVEVVCAILGACFESLTVVNITVTVSSEGVTHVLSVQAVGTDGRDQNKGFFAE